MDTRDIQAARHFAADKMAKVNLFETPRFFLDLYCLEPNQAQTLHRHADNDKVYVVLEGQGRFQIGPDEKVLGQNQAVLAPAGVDHGLVNDSQGRLVVLTFMAPHPRLSGTGGGATGTKGDEAMQPKVDQAGGTAGVQQRLQELERLFKQFSGSFDKIWAIIAQGQAGNLLREALEDPEELERAARLRTEVQTALQRLRDSLGNF